MLNHICEPIIISPERIVAAAQEVANSDDTACQYNADRYLAAFRKWLEASIASFVNDANYFACQIEDGFSVEAVEATKFSNFTREADELVMPASPNRATRPRANHTTPLTTIARVREDADGEPYAI